MCNDTVSSPRTFRASVSSLRQFCSRSRSFSRPRRESRVSSVDSSSNRHSYCSTDSLDSGIDLAPPSSPSMSARSSPLRSSLRSPGTRSNSKSAGIRFHPQVLIWAAVQNGDFEELFDALVECGTDAQACTSSSSSRTVDLNHTNQQGITLLHLCSFAGSAKCVRLLLALGANPTRYDGDGWTPLHAAAVGAHDEIVHMLVAAGAKIDAVDVFGRRPLDVTANKVTKALLRFLLSRQSETSRGIRRETSITTTRRSTEV